MTANTEELISHKIEWRQRVLDFQAAFPQLEGLTVVVIDGKTPELADRAAERLVDDLRSKPHLFKTVEQPQGGPFFAQNGLLLLPLVEVRATTESLTRAQPILASLAADPSLRGVLGHAVDGPARRKVRAGEAHRLRARDDDAGRDVREGHSWSARLHVLAANTHACFHRRNGHATGPPDQTGVELQRPAAGRAASAAIRATARSLGLDPAHGVTVRLTGPVPLADEEFGSLAQDADMFMGGMVAALLVILWLSVRSARIVIAMLLTTFIGLVITTAIGLLVSAVSTSSRSPSSRCSSASASTSPSSSAFAVVPSGSPIPSLPAR